MENNRYFCDVRIDSVCYDESTKYCFIGWSRDARDSSATMQKNVHREIGLHLDMYIRSVKHRIRCEKVRD